MSMDSISIFIGIGLALLFAALSSLGVNLQALSLQRDKKHSSAPVSTNDIESIQDSTLSDSMHESPLQDIQEQENDTSNGSCSFQSKRQIPYWTWYFGLFLYLSSEMFGSLAALAFLSPILVAPLGSLGLVFNIYFSYLLRCLAALLYLFVSFVKLC